MCFKKWIEPSREYLYFVFRVFAGSMFAYHGAQKLGFLTSFVATGFAPFGQAWLGTFVAYVELLAGLAILFGFLTRLAALGGAVDMVFAYFIAHSPSVLWNPLSGKGELAMLYFGAFLVLLAYGAGKWSLEKTFFKKELLW